MESVRLRPHHLIRDIGRYLEWIHGMNGGQAGIRHYHAYLERTYGKTYADLEEDLIISLIKNPDIPIEITDSWDKFCIDGKCKLRSTCTYEKESVGDVSLVERIGLTVGQSTTSGYVVSRIREVYKIDQRLISPNGALNSDHI